MSDFFGRCQGQSSIDFSGLTVRCVGDYGHMGPHAAPHAGGVLQWPKEELDELEKNYLRESLGLASEQEL